MRDNGGAIAGFVVLVTLILGASMVSDLTSYRDVMVDRPRFHSHLVFLWIAVNSIMGYLLGRFRGREWAGATWSVVLGPVGWLVTLVLADQRYKCPACFSVIDPRATICPHCRTAR